MGKFELEGVVVNITRGGEAVEGKLIGSKFGSHYNAEWTNSDGQIFIGTVEDWEIKKIDDERRQI